MWESRSDFQGRWEGWKTCLWFSRLSTDRHFHGFPLLGCFGSFLLLFRGSAEAIRFRTGLQNMGAISDAIEKRRESEGGAGRRGPAGPAGLMPRGDQAERCFSIKRRSCWVVPQVRHFSDVPRAV